MIQCMLEKNIYEPCYNCEACIERAKAGESAGIPEINNYQVRVP